MKNHKENISRLKNCYGCGVCSIICPTNIIELEYREKQGFYFPKIENQNKCIECGLCLEVCAFNHSELASQPDSSVIKAYGSWSKDAIIRNDSTSGGLGYEMGKEGLRQNMSVCSVIYDLISKEAKHVIIHDFKSLKQTQGTKYIPSFTENGFKLINKLDKFIIFGLPCQIDSLRRYIKKFKIESNFILVDLFCYGVPSLLLWREFLSQNHQRLHDIIRIKFRSKTRGWHHSTIIETENSAGEIHTNLPNREFYSLFFSDTCLNKCCYLQCKYKLCRSSADIRLGDFWGDRYKNNELGVNVVLSFTKTGNQFISRLHDSCNFEEVTIAEACAGQKSQNAEYCFLRPFILFCLRWHFPLKLLKLIVRGSKIVTDPKRVLKKLRK